MMRVPAGLATFDSATAMLRATARFLQGRDFPALGEPRYFEPIAAAVNWLPARLRELVFSLGGFMEAVPPEAAKHVDAERIASWLADHYPKRPYPAAMIGSSNGALVHVCAALGIPWLPQTFLTLVRQRHSDPDDARTALEQGDLLRRLLATANPGISVHHMHDPVQDRVMIQRVAYFRLKYRCLPAAYRIFLSQLAPGATIFMVECRRPWPLVTCGERQYFQFGAVGGPTPEDYFASGERVARYLTRMGAPQTGWTPPQPDTQGPEAEWGFEDSLRNDVAAFAAERGYRVVRMIFENPEDPSPLVADLYRRWYREREIECNRLLIESFVLLEPYWTLRAGLVPFWMVFNVEASISAIRHYLARSGPFDEIYMMLFPNGTEGLGFAPLETWRGLLREARRSGAFLGVDERRYPRDFAAFARSYRALKRLGPRAPLPAPQDPTWFETFARTAGPLYGIRMLEPELVHPTLS